MKRLRRAILVAVLVSLTTTAFAQPNLEVAKDLFRRGVTLYEAGDLQAALDYFRRSRAAYPSKQNTINLAITLQALDRPDEALEMYEETLTSFGPALSEAERATITRAFGELRARVGELEITSNATATALVDGRERGRLPLSRAIRLLPGARRVRVVKDGYATAERVIEIRIGAASRIDVPLSPLAASGGLRVEAPEIAGGDVIVDGAVVGALPWEGTLAPGSHVVSARKHDQGSAPMLAVVLQGQTALLRLRAARLGPTTRIAVPPSAELRLNGVPLGRGPWEGALPLGQYLAEALEDGYLPRRASFAVGATPVTLDLRLEVNREHPRWPRKDGRLWIGALGGLAVGASLKSGGEGQCPGACRDDGLALGGAVGLHAGYELPSGTSLEIGGGYLSVYRAFHRQLAERFPRDTRQYEVTYQLDETVRIRGTWLAGMVSQRLPLGRGWALRPRVGAGAILVRASSALSGEAVSIQDSVPIGVEGVNTITPSAPFLLITELGVERALGPWRVGVALSAWFVPAAGPAFARGALIPEPRCAVGSQASAGCAPASEAVRSDRSYGPFMLIVPSIRAGYLF